MKTILRKKIIPLESRSLETYCGRCGRVFQNEPYFLIRRYHRTGKISGKRVCNKCISLYR